MKKRSTIFLLGILVSFSLFAFPEIGKAEKEQELPLMVDFELFYGTNLHEVYPGWMEGKGHMQPEYMGGAWYRADVIHGSATAAITFDYSGLKDDWVISPQFMATSTTKVSFMAGLSRFWDEPAQGSFSHNDSVSVMVATEGLTFNHHLFSFKMENQPAWYMEHFEVDLSEFEGQVITLAFYATNGQEANSLGAFHLDDIVIKDAVEYDAMALDLVSPVSGSCLYEGAPVIVSIKNDGIMPISSVPVRVRVRGASVQNIFGSYEGTIQPGEIVEFQVGTLSETAYGDHTLSVTTEFPGDGFNINDVVEGIKIPNPEPKTLPLPLMDFVGLYQVVGDLYPDWYEARGKDHPLVAMNTDWQGGNYMGARTANVYFTGLGTEDWLVGPKITATENLTVEMRAAVQYEQGTTQMGADDFLGIMVSEDCGESFQMVGKIEQNSGVNQNLQAFSFPIPQFAGQDIIVALYASTGLINNPQKYYFHITDLHVKNQYDLDAGITRLLAPGNSCAFTNNEEVIVEIKNFGTQSISNFDVAFVLNDGTPVVETVTETITYNQSLVYTFSSTIDLTSETENVLSVYTMLENDEFSDNDGFYDMPLVLSSFDLTTQGTYSMGFEDDEDFSAWVVDDANNDGITWYHQTDPTYANSGNNSFAFFSNQSSVASNDWLISPCFSLQQGETYYVSFYYRNRATSWPESLKLNLGTSQSGSSMNQLIIDLGQIDNGNFIKAETTFTVEESGEYYLGWHAYGPADQFGLYVDDIVVRQVFNHDLSAANYNIPRLKTETCGLVPAESIEVEVENLGQQNITEFSIGLSIDGADALMFDFTQNIPAGESQWITIENGFTVQPDQIYDIALWTQHAQDNNSANDSIFIENYLMAQYNTSFEATDDLSGWTSLSLAGSHQWQLLENPSVARTGQHVYSLRTDGSGGNTATDDWLFSECFYLEAGTCYEISFWYRSHFSTEFMTVHIGTDQTPAAMTDMLLEMQGFDSNHYIQATYQFAVEESGVYHFGWHSFRPITTGAYFIYIDDLSVVEDLDNQPSADPQYLALDREVAFYANSENVSSYHWDFGDGNTSDQMNPFHQYETPGTYQASLVAGSGCVGIEYNFDVIVDLPEYNVVFDVKNFSGDPLAGAVVTIDGIPSEPGVYQFDRIQGGYTFLVELEGHDSAQGFFTVVDSDITVEAMLVAEGEKFEVTFNIEDESGDPVSDAVITIGNNSFGAGVYVIGNILPGSYDFTISAPGYHQYEGQVVVIDQDVTVDVVMIEILSYSVTFRVKDIGGNDISDAVVTFDGIANQAGDYVVEGVLPGTYDYSIDLDGYQSSAGQVTVSNSNVSLDVILFEIPTYQVTFQVNDADGNAVADAVVTFDGNTLQEGVYTVTDVQAGTYNYMVSHNDYADVDGQVEIIDQNVTVTVTFASTSVTTPEAIDFNIFPNPANDRLNVTFTGDVQIIRVVNLTGQVMIENADATSGIGRVELNISSLRAGTYILQIISGGNVHPAVFIKK